MADLEKLKSSIIRGPEQQEKAGEVPKGEDGSLLCSGGFLITPASPTSPLDADVTGMPVNMHHH
ncbi:hypothetical protein [Tritonibacter mobilis]|uniref:hypothetical protein n=1 Tax=Tritonibacter mobilis TaxID=379347 RepID=UPI001C09CBF7|nr:hypothetical protein [Tritonibacter mobilis]MBU3033649.1 hypothetical protein [Tritonibacter mobilis]WHQ84375.1 hypothetical protein OMR53_19680 [Tritonibacter mobilis]